VSGFPVKF
jgi:hypothetical protein